jgi:hypothetical protein
MIQTRLATKLPNSIALLEKYFQKNPVLPRVPIAKLDPHHLPNHLNTPYVQNQSIEQSSHGCHRSPL